MFFSCGVGGRLGSSLGGVGASAVAPARAQPTFSLGPWPIACKGPNTRAAGVKLSRDARWARVLPKWRETLLKLYRLYTRCIQPPKPNHCVTQ